MESDCGLGDCNLLSGEVLGTWGREGGQMADMGQGRGQRSWSHRTGAGGRGDGGRELGCFCLWVAGAGGWVIWQFRGSRMTARGETVSSALDAVPLRWPWEIQQ